MTLPERLRRFLVNVNAPLALIDYATQLAAQEEERCTRAKQNEKPSLALLPFDNVWME